MPSAWLIPLRASSARIVVGITGVPEPRADELSTETLGTPDPLRSHCEIVTVWNPDMSALVQRHMSQAVRRSADTIVRWPSEPGAGATPAGTGIGLPSQLMSPFTQVGSATLTSATGSPRCA